MPVGEEPSAKVTAIGRCTREGRADEVAQLLASIDDTLLRADQMPHQGALQPDILSVERHRGLDVLRLQRRIPRPVYSFDRIQGCRIDANG
jgi:hypothetical protein